MAIKKVFQESIFNKGKGKMIIKKVHLDCILKRDRKYDNKEIPSREYIKKRNNDSKEGT